MNSTRKATERLWKTPERKFLNFFQYFLSNMDYHTVSRTKARSLALTIVKFAPDLILNTEYTGDIKKNPIYDESGTILTMVNAGDRTLVFETV